MFTLFQRALESSLSRGAVVTFTIRVAGAGLLFGLHVVLARWMGADGYGAYAFAVSGASVAAQFGALGLPSAALRFVPTYLSDKRPGTLWSFLHTGRWIVGGTTIALVALVFGAVFFLPLDPLSRQALLLGLWLAPLMALGSFETEVLRGHQQFALSYVPNHILRPLGIGGSVGLLLWLTGGVSVVEVLLCMGGVLLCLILFQQWGTRAHTPSSSDEPDTPGARYWLRVALPLLLVGGFQLVLSKTDILLVGGLIGSDEAGIYFAAMRIAQVVTFFGFAVDAVTAPIVSRLYRNDHQALQDTVSTLAHWYFWPSLIAALALALLAHPLLSLFGTAFTTGGPVLYVYLIGLLANAATGAQTYLLTLTGHERACAHVFGWCAALNIGLNLVGIVFLGALGAALATATTLAVRNLWIRQHVVRHTGIHPSIVAAVRTDLASHA
ncbi:MAG: oligosaccharide flippase family protein [Salinivenus sp.]